MPTALPLYRQEAIYARDKVDLDRALMAQWMGRLRFELDILSGHILTLIKKAERIFADETTLPTLVPGSGSAQDSLSLGLRPETTGPSVVLGRRWLPIALRIADLANASPAISMAIAAFCRWMGIRPIIVSPDPTAATIAITLAGLLGASMDAPALARHSFAFLASSAAAVIYPACRGKAPRFAGLDGKIRKLAPNHVSRARSSMHPTGLCQFRFARFSPSRSERSSHPRRPFGDRSPKNVRQPDFVGCRIFPHAVEEPRQFAPSCWQ